MDDIVIQSHKGSYTVHFDRTFAGLQSGLATHEHLIIDARVADLYSEALGPALAGHSVLRIEATESNKSLEKFPDYVMHLLDHGVRRDHVLVAVGEASSKTSRPSLPGPCSEDCHGGSIRLRYSPKQIAALAPSRRLTLANTRISLVPLPLRMKSEYRLTCSIPLARQTCARALVR